MSGIATWTGTLVHGRRSAYVKGCRCVECKRACAEKYHRRRALIAAAIPDIVPSGPPIPGLRPAKGQRPHPIIQCPGANGASCVVSPATALRSGRTVCIQCATAVSWDGNVPADRARAHIIALGALGVGYKSVAAAASITSQVLGGVRTGRKTHIRKTTELAILAVDAGARADGALVDATKTWVTIRRLLKKGFSKSELGRLLGSTAKVPTLQVGRSMCTLEMTVRVARLAKRVHAGAVEPQPGRVPGVRAKRAEIRELLERGVPYPKKPDQRPRFLAELAELRRRAGIAEVREDWSTRRKAS